jgi:hypothetical protein
MFVCSLKGEKLMSYDLNGSAAAAPRGEASTTNNVEAKIASLSNQDALRQRKWFDSGVRAKKRGYGDMSPFYENKTADYFFKCGYAGTSFEQAQETLTEKIKELFTQDCTVFETVNELVK